MGFSTAVKSCMRQFATFSGRARRAEFWMFYLFLSLVVLLGFFVVMLVALAVFATNTTGQEPSGVAIAIYLVVVILWALGVVALWVPFLAVSARRLHDIGQSGHWLWLYLASLGIVPLIMAFMDSQWGPNQWGPDPKAAERGPLPAAYQYPPQPENPPPAPPVQ